MDLKLWLEGKEWGVKIALISAGSEILTVVVGEFLFSTESLPSHLTNW